MNAQNTPKATVPNKNTQRLPDVSEFKEIDSEWLNIMRPGLGIDNFSSNEIQQQLETIRQFSATPLQLQLHKEPTENVANEQIDPQAENQSSIQTDKQPGNSFNSVTENELKFAPRRFTSTANNEPPPVPESLPEQSSPAKNLTSKIASPQTLKESIIPQRSTPNKQINISKTIPLGDPFYLSLHGLIWTYIPGLSEFPRKPEFERELGNLETSFDFRFPAVGRYFLTFSRQFPSTGELEYYNAEIIVESLQSSESGSDEYQTMIATPIEQNNPVAEQSVQLSSNASKNMSDLNNDISYRITSQVISDIRRMLKDGELDAAYQTLNSWPARERGDIYDTAARYFLDADMYSEAVDMWQRNVNLEGDLQGKAIVGISRALSNSNDSSSVLSWLPQFLEQAKNQQNSTHQSPLIHSEDFAKVFKTLSNVPASSKDAEQILDFYQTYVTFYPDQNSPEILYNMALFFEQPGKNQDIRRARQLYSNIQANYPVDEYNQKAYKRLNYLNRQFFLVR